MGRKGKLLSIISCHLLSYFHTVDQLNISCNHKEVICYYIKI